ncbi:hypothetical protein [Pseudomonas sp.]|uniref:hypothetical protein n=1 Tax=Pseudomonas sp. TaxID=306 RepID=UPI002735153C|nr:hypothetical protein [Pseudomonas sp.]MDP3815339.1 hypothetical protein [Pseudomonas sp.]
MHDPILLSSTNGQAALQQRASNANARANQSAIAKRFASSKPLIRSIPEQGAPSPATIKQSLTVHTEGGRQLKRCIQRHTPLVRQP